MGRVCDDDGQVICDEGEVRKRWRDYFAMLLQSNDHHSRGYHGEILMEQRRWKKLMRRSHWRKSVIVSPR